MATITASAAGGNWNTTAAWNGGIQPSAADDVLLASTSGSITIPTGVTVACRSIDCTGYTATLAFAGTGILNVGDASGGKATFVSTMTLTFTASNVIKFLATTASTTYQLTTGGKAMPQFVFQTGSTTTIQFADNVNCGTTLVQLLSGILDMNSKTLICGTFDSNSATARTLTMGAANITCSTASAASWNVPTANAGTLTVTTNTATINITGSSGQFVGGSNKNWNGLSLTISGSGNGVVNAPGCTIANLTRNGSGATLFQVVTSITVTGTLTIAGVDTANRITVWGGNIALIITITVNGTVSVSYTDFANTIAAGTASWNLAVATGGTGDLTGNTGITFTTAATQTRTGAGGNWSDTAKWTSRIPLPQDDVIVGSGASGTITADLGNLGHNIDFTGFTGSLTLTKAIAIYGSLTTSSGMTVTGAFALNFEGQGGGSVTSNGVSWPGPIVFQLWGAGAAGTYTLQDDFTTVSTLTVTTGTLNTNGKTVTATTLTISNASGFFGGLTAGTSIFNLTSTANGILFSVALSGSVISAANATFNVVNASTNSRTFQGASKTYGILTYTVAGSTGALFITGGNNFDTINFSDATNARTLTFTNSTTTTIRGRFNVKGTSGKLMSLNTDLSGTSATILKRNNWNIGANSTLVSGTTGLTVAAGDVADFISAKDITGTIYGRGNFFGLM